MVDDRNQQGTGPASRALCRAVSRLGLGSSATLAVVCGLAGDFIKMEPLWLVLLQPLERGHPGLAVLDAQPMGFARC